MVAMRNKFKVFQTVIVLNAVPMVNIFKRFEITAKMLFHNKPMFSNILLVSVSDGGVFRRKDVNVVIRAALAPNSTTTTLPPRVSLSGLCLTHSGPSLFRVFTPQHRRFFVRSPCLLSCLTDFLTAFFCQHRRVKLDSEPLQGVRDGLGVAASLSRYGLRFLAREIRGANFQFLLGGEFSRSWHVAIIPRFLTERRNLARLDSTEERLESEVYTDGNVLQHLRMHLSQSGVRFLEFGKARLLRVQRWTLARFGIRVPALCEQRIVQTPAFSERLNHLSLLSGSRLQPIAKGFTHM